MAPTPSDNLILMPADSIKSSTALSKFERMVISFKNEAHSNHIKEFIDTTPKSGETTEELL
eukprot:11331919-Ditylum_brightwellii.AAC.2